ncbi:MAG: 50S ribosomal protein L10 [candidate division WOR-3 bacterium]
MPSQKNVETLKKNTEMLKNGKAFYFTEFTGLNVQQMENLRKELKKNQCNYLVIKNTLGLLAFKNLGYEIDSIKSKFFGPLGIAIAYDDPLGPTRILQDTQGLKIKGAFIEGTVFDAKGVAELAKIPSKNVLLQSLVGSLNVIGNLVNTLNSVLQNFVYTVDALKDKTKN